VTSQDEIRLFKRSIVSWTLRLAALLLVIAAAIGRREITLGLAFGLCIGLVNFDLMTRFNAAQLRGAGSGKNRAAVFGTFMRMGLIFVGAAAVWYKEWNFIAAAIGCFSVYPVLIVHGLLMGRRPVKASAEGEGYDA